MLAHKLVQMGVMPDFDTCIFLVVLFVYYMDMVETADFKKICGLTKFE